MALDLQQLEFTPQVLSQSAASLSEEQLDLLEQTLRKERLRRLSGYVPEDETALIRAVNKPMPHGDRHAELSIKWQAGELTDEERAEMIAIVEDREQANVERVAAVMRLAELRGTTFEQLWQKMVGSTPDPVSIAG